MNEAIKKENVLGANMPCHINLGSSCCGIFNVIKNETVVCNECGLELNEVLSIIKGSQKIVVTENSDGEWTINYLKFNDETDIVVSEEIAKEIIRLQNMF